MEGKQLFEHWALVELFGHQRIAGKVTEAEIGGGKFIRVDVPAIADRNRQPITRLYSPAAIYGITPLTEETAIALAGQINMEPVTRWDARNLLKELPAPQVHIETYEPTDDDDEEGED